MKKNILGILVLAVFVLLGTLWIQSKVSTGGLLDMGMEEGVVTLKLGEGAKFEDLTIRVVSLEEDSRCAIDVICIWAGTVKIKLETISGLGTAETLLELGKSMTTEVEEVTLVSVTPSRMESVPTELSDYRFTLEVKKR